MSAIVSYVLKLFLVRLYWKIYGNYGEYSMAFKICGDFMFYYTFSANLILIIIAGLALICQSH